MQRISSDMTNRDMNYHLRLREWKMNELNNKMAAQSRIKDLRNDPLGAARSTRFSSEITRLERYGKNIETARGVNAIAEGYLREANDILQRIREIGVQGGNGIYGKEEMGYMGEEVDQLLHELVLIGNARTADGTTLFSGFKNATEPFKITMGHAGNEAGQRIVSVDYMGNIGENKTEISQGAYAAVNMPGNHVFWAEFQQIYSTTDATTYQVQADTSIKIDGVQIDLKEGDNVYAISDKINNADIAVRAKLDPIRNSLVLSTTTPHQMWLEDQGTGRVLETLGILTNRPGQQPPLNINANAQVFGGSLFDMVIHMRDSLFKGDVLQIGGSGLRGIDEGMNNLRNVIAELGSRDERLEVTGNRLNYESPELVSLKAKETDLDLTQAVTELKMLEYTHKAALSTTARILQPTLLDFLR